MSGHDYKPHHPSFYKTAWNYGLTKCIEKPGEWVSVDWARTPSSAGNRMERLRAFRDGAMISPEVFPGFKELLETHELRFRKQVKFMAYDIQMSMQPKKDKIAIKFIDP